MSTNKKATTTPTKSKKVAPVVAVDERSERILAIRAALKERDDARDGGDYGKSDQIRDRLVKDYEVELIDQKNGPSGFKFRDGSSTKLTPGVSLPTSDKKQSKSKTTPETNNNTSTTTPSSASKKKRSREEEDKPATSSSNKKQKPAASVAVVSAAAEKEKERNKALLAATVQKKQNGGEAPEVAGSASRMMAGVQVTTLKRGTGSRISKVGDKLQVYYVGKLQATQKVFDSCINKKPFSFRLGRGEVIPGWDVGMLGMTLGETRRLVIPPEKAYGRQGAPPSIPSNATLNFEVSLIGFA